jgi:hypothetical protein
MGPINYLLVFAVIGLNRRLGAVGNCRCSIPYPISALPAINMLPFVFNLEFYCTNGIMLYRFCVGLMKVPCSP